MKKRHLKASAQTLKTSVPDANPRRGQERKRGLCAATRVGRQGTSLSRPGARRGRRGQVQASGATSVESASGAVAAPIEAAWDSIRTGLRRDLGARTFDGWLKPAELGAFEPDSGMLDIVMPSQFMADWVRSHFGERLALAWKTVLPVVRAVRIVAAADAPRPAPLLILEEAPLPVERDPNTPNFDPRYRF